jgi:predicted Zn-dependent protease with MMP-like domain
LAEGFPDERLTRQIGFRYRASTRGGYRGRMDQRQPPFAPRGPRDVPVDFDTVIDGVLEDLPDPFLQRLGSVAIVVEEEATPEQLASVGARGLYGLYQGVPRTRFGVDNVPMPSKITVFRGPLIRAHGTGERLTRAIEDTLLHEIAHHFGIDDDRLHALRAEGRATRISRAEHDQDHHGHGHGHGDD